MIKGRFSAVPLGTASATGVKNSSAGNPDGRTLWLAATAGAAADSAKDLGGGVSASLCGTVGIAIAVALASTPGSGRTGSPVSSPPTGSDLPASIGAAGFAAGAGATEAGTAPDIGSGTAVTTSVSFVCGENEATGGVGSSDPRESMT